VTPSPNQVPHRIAPRARNLAILSGVITAALGLMVIVGWISHCTPLVQLRPGFAPMQFNTALCFVLLGIALALSGWGRGGRAVSILGGLAALVGILTIAEYIFRANLQIDQLFFHPYTTVETAFAGRMSPFSACSIAFAGAALMILGKHSFHSLGPPAVGAVASIMISIGLVALVSYPLGIQGSYGWAEFTRVPVYTAVGLCLLGAGLFGIAWHIGLGPGEHAPRWLPVPLALAVFTGSLVLYSALEIKQEEAVAQTVKADAEGAKNQIAIRMDSRFRSLTRMARDWQIFGVPTQAAWEAESVNYVRDIPDVQALEWLDSTRHVRWVAASDGAHGSLDNLPPDKFRTMAMDQADRENEPVVTRIVTLAGGQRGFVIYAPMTVNGKRDGYLAGVFKGETCLERYLPPAVAPGEAISVDEDYPDFFDRDTGSRPRHKEWEVVERIKLRGATWNLRMWPTPSLAARLDSPLPAVVPFAGAFGGLLLGAVSFYAQRSSRQAAETSRANTALRAALDTVKTLEGLLPICCYCKRVRDDSGYWNQIDTYLRRHTKASLSHSYCPECAVKFYEECGIDVPEKVKAEMEAGNYE
jgi:sensor domain CHASE-containing protein